MEAQVLRFENPDYLYWLLIIPVMIAVYVLVNIIQKKRTQKLASTTMFKYLAPQMSGRRRNFKFTLLCLTVASLIFALANLQSGAKMQEVKREGIDLFICVDVSNSMNAEDIAPSRIERSKQAINKLVSELKGDRIGLIVFANRAYIQLPITTDYSAARMFISNVKTDIVPSQGTNIGEAINTAVKAFGENKHSKAIIIISDGEDHETEALKAAEEASKQGIRVYTIGMGLADGAPIPTYNQYGKMTGYRKDRNGQTIITKLNETMLQQIAVQGKGLYVRANNSNVGLEKIYDDICQLEKTEIEAKVFSDYEDQFQWFVGLAIIFMIINTFVSARAKDWENRFNFFDRKK